jgi:methenyltetrahydromethanopterin cyclohydrolase
VNSISVNALTTPLVEDLAAAADRLRLAVDRPGGGARIIDAGIAVAGGLEAGRRIAEICLGGLGSVRLRASGHSRSWPWQVDVHSVDPVLACLGSQYAGWSLSHGEGKQGFFALGSGPGRAAGSREELFEELGYRDRADQACLVLEAGKAPPPELCEKIAEQCGIPAPALTLILTPTSSLAGAVQIVARVLETALHKAHALGFPLDAVVDGAGSAPLCPPSPDFLTAMSRTNDAILFAGQVQLFVAAGDEEARDLSEKLPSSASSDYGRPFGEIFKGVNYDFYQIDPMLFSPARVIVSSLKTGHSFPAGRVDPELLDRSFGRDIG